MKDLSNNITIQERIISHLFFGVIFYGGVFDGLFGFILWGIFDGLFGFIFAVASAPFILVYWGGLFKGLFGFIWVYWGGLFKGLLGKIFILVLYKLPLLTFTN